MMLNKARVAPVVAEFLGTAILVMVALVLTETTAVSYFVGTSVAVTLGVVYMFFGSLSGGHFNPAISFGMWTARRISTLKALGYVIAQFLGGLASWQLYQYFTDKTLPTKSTHFTWPMFVAELIGTAVLAIGLASAIARGFNQLETALTYAASYFVGIMIAATVSAAYLNPAIALGLRNFNALYVLGPLVGGVIGINLYMMLFAPMKSVTKKK